MGATPSREIRQLQAHRLANNPIITPETPGYDVERMGTNINGPSLIRVPDWLPNPLGRYYLYFGHHKGDHIRLAYADDLQGPWRIHEPGTLPLESTPCNHHLASPDVVVDHEAHQLRMYYHGPTPSVPADDPLIQRWPFIGKQRSHVAVSEDGLNFEHVAGPFATSYARIWRYDGWHYAFSMPGLFSRSPDGLHDWQSGPMRFTRDVRHAVVRRVGDELQLFFSIAGDCPEHIVMSTMPMIGDWMDWRPSEPMSVLRPELDWEGADCPLEASQRGAIHERAHQLRDPGIFEEDGRTYLLYSVAGEAGIAIAELQD